MLRGGLSATLSVLLVCRAAFPAGAEGLSAADRDQLAIYARDTWRSFEALAAVGPLPADNIVRTEIGWRASEFTSPTNIAAYLWSTIAAEDLRIISGEESGLRLGRVLQQLGRTERYRGFFYNWYNPRTGDRLKAWPGGGPVRPFLSSVDNGWLAAALMMVANRRPELRAPAEALLGPMNFGFFYDPFDPADPLGHPGLLRGGYYPEEGAFTTYHYGMLNTEPRIASYIAIARGDVPADHYFRMKRSDGRPAFSRRYGDVSVPQGSRLYRGLRVLPSWDGTMFEALMVPLFVPEAAWAGASWGRNHPNYLQAQIDYGMKDARLGFWGISAASDPEGGYDALGVPPLAATANPKTPTGVITPHASFLALAFAPRQAMENLRALALLFPVYGEYGFLDSVDVKQGRVSSHVLALDQGMILAAIANSLGGNALQNAFCAGAIEAVIRPLIAPERFALDTLDESPLVSVPEEGPGRPAHSDVPLPLLGSSALIPEFAGPSRRRKRVRLDVPRRGWDDPSDPGGPEDALDRLDLDLDLSDPGGVVP